MKPNLSISPERFGCTNRTDRFAAVRTWASVRFAERLRGLLLVAALLALAGCGFGLKPGQADATAYQYRPYELTFTSTGSYTNPFDYTEVDFKAVFSGPGGASMEVLGFWDGGQTWKIRFAPPAAGLWTYTTLCSNAADTGLHGLSGSFTADAAAGPNPLYEHGGILQASENGRYLTYQDGTPFFYLADTWWNAPSRRLPIDRFGTDVPSTIEHPYSYSVDKRAAQGYTVLQMHGSKGMFESETDSSTFIFDKTDNNDSSDIAYWQQYDKYYEYANEKGLLVNMGVAGHTLLDPYDLDELKRLYRYMFARHGAYAMMSLMTQEYNSPSGDTEGRREKLFELAAYLRSIDPYKRLITMHMSPVSSPDPSWDEPWNDWVMDQNGHFHTPNPKDYYFIYNRCACKPLLESELNYEGFDNGAGFVADAKMVRSSAYTAIQSGAFGFGYGASGSYSSASKASDQPSNWGPVYKWWEALEFDGGAQMKWLRQAYERVAWWKLEPALNAIPSNRKLLVKADTFQTYVIWYPDNVSVASGTKLQQSAYDGAVYKPTWINPRTGAATALTDMTVTGTEMTLPNRPDTSDWLLMLEYKGGGKLPVLPSPAIDIAASWTFDTSVQGWSAGGDIGGFAWQSGGYAGGAAAGGDPQLYSPDHLAIGTDDKAIIKLRLKNGTTATHGQLYFVTNADTAWNDAKKIVFPMNVSESVYTEYVIDMSHLPQWKGTLKQLRLDPGDSVYGLTTGGTFSLDSFVIGSRAAAPPAIEWTFASSVQGWTAGGQISGFAWQSGGYAGGTSSGDDPQLFSPDNLNVDITNNKIIKLRLKNGSTSTTGQLYFSTTTDTAFDGTKRREFTMVASDSGYTDYILDMSDIPQWTGTLKRLRFDPGDARVSGATNGYPFSIDSIAIQSCY